MDRPRNYLEALARQAGKVTQLLCKRPVCLSITHKSLYLA